MVLPFRHRRQHRITSVPKNRAIVARYKISAPLDTNTAIISRCFQLTEAGQTAFSPGQFSVRLQMICPQKPRKIYLELNTENRHLLRIRAYGRGELDVSFQVPVQSESGDRQLYLVSFLAQRFNQGDFHAAETSRRAVPFCIMDTHFPMVPPHVLARIS